MDLQKIKELIDVLAASDLAEIELVEGENRVRLVKRLRAEDDAGLRAAPGAAHLAAHAAPENDAAPHASQPALSNTEAGEWVTAPLYGVVHLTPSPDAAAFVQPGELVQAGQTLCVIEAMKMFHEVKASHKGRVVAILATAGEEAEAGAALFQLKAAE
jgi:acetyl-CoA carboxylase biotin carboxyl carrier protein